MSILQVDSDLAASIRAWGLQAQHEQAPRLRTDSRRSSSPMTAARAATLQWAMQTANRTARQLADEGVRMDSERVDRFAQDLCEATVAGLGWRTEGGEIRSDSLRTDASWFAPGALTAPMEGALIRPAYTPRILAASIPTRTIPAWAETYPSGAISEAGNVALYRPGMTNIPTVGANSTHVQRGVHTFVNKTSRDFMVLMRAEHADFSVVQADAQAAQEAFARFRESTLVTGVAGIDFRGLNDIGITRYQSTLDYSSGSTTMDAMHADLFDGANSIRVNAGYRGQGFDTALIGPSLAAAIMRKSNYDVGGTASGADLMMALTKINASLATSLQSSGISMMMEAPALDELGAADESGMLLFSRSDGNSLRQVVAMNAAPVRTNSSLTAEETLYAARLGGLELRSTLNVGLFVAKVRS